MPLTRLQEQDSVIIADLSSGLGKDDAIKLDAFGLQKQVSDVSLWHGMFSFDINPRQWRATVDGAPVMGDYNVAGRAESKYGSGEFSCSSTVGSRTIVSGTRYPRYQPNRGIMYASAGTIPNPQATGGIRRWGIFTPENGYFFEVSPDGICYTVLRNNVTTKIVATAGQTILTADEPFGADDKVYVRTKLPTSLIWEDISSDIASVNNVAGTVTMTTPLSDGTDVRVVVVKDLKNEITNNLASEGIDISKGTLFDIQVAWRGAGNATWFVRSENASHISKGVKVVYRNLGQYPRPSVSNPALCASYEVENVSSIIPMSLTTNCTDISTEGGSQRDSYIYYSASNRNTPQITIRDITRNERILMIIHVPSLHKGMINTRDILLKRLSVYALDDSIFNVYTSPNPVFLSGSLLLKPTDDGSCVLFDNALSADNATARGIEFDTTSGAVLVRGRVPAGGTTIVEKPADEVDFNLPAGGYVVITAQLAAGKSGTTQAGAVLEWGEGV